MQATGLGTYPDVTVVRGALELDPEDPKQQTVLNPRFIVEVLSPSTEDYDRGEKLVSYQQIPSLECVAPHCTPRERVAPPHPRPRPSAQKPRHLASVRMESWHLPGMLGLSR